MESNTLNSEVFVVLNNKATPIPNKWADYLYTHLKNRSISGPKIIQKNSQSELTKGEFGLQIEVRPSSTFSYEIVRDKNKLLLICRSEAIALWLIYELIEKIGQDNLGLAVEDLPPATIDFVTSKKEFDFDYREPFFAPNTDIDHARIMGNNSIDTDWGIWGHQLAQIIDNQNPDTQAEINGTKTKQQFCFSSPLLYSQVKAYIIDQHGLTPSLNFMLAPNDNDLVCNCKLCLTAQNTATNASPSVLRFNNRLAKDFPTAHFFMLAYRTTQNPGIVRLEKNVGIFLSTIHLPKGQLLDENSQQFESFKQQILNWKKLTAAVYLWDYAANFDDYLTPIPVLIGFQKQAQQFKSLGVTGLFLHASGYDYAPFDDVKTYVISALMRHVDQDVNKLVATYLKHFYPKSHQLLTNYYSELEYNFQQSQRHYDLYSSFDDLKNSYFNTVQFTEFYKSLHQIIPTTHNSERVKLEKLYSALGFTQLQTAYSCGIATEGAFSLINGQINVKSDIEKEIHRLEKDFKQHKILNYSERNTIDSYLNQWQEWIKKPYSIKPIKTNQLESKNIDLKGLTDGKLGFSRDFLLGWTIGTKDLEFQISQLPTGSFQVKMRFLNDPTHHIYPPKEVRITDSDSLQQWLITVSKNNDNTVEYTFTTKDLDSNASSIDIKIFNQTATKSQWACDEIQISSNQ
ncbi:DUF4838 domain-containing protein [Flavobacterium sp. NKUCC04_CG]|uniref:DUF4838 domain-containing protein n=1 Tax=Flavobacterium sp. NKUCC04_CG TaxID=2842121 RepID=UPI001C5BACB8|nr:DUF4838 domain-containing protein [Flavobacterium sp. NKUCC04_CG]MBW3520072.1 DUF4838 domain-containing protein [Flavobacterium sp. NKUCC04_CG]